MLVVFPTLWDARQIAACPRIAERHDVRFTEPTAERCTAELDVLAFLDHVATTRGESLAGVTSSCDDPGAVCAAVLAQRLGLPGCRPEALLRAAHKLESRRVQARAVPEATPAFALVDPQRPPGVDLDGLTFPCFVKPVRGSFSVLARRIDDAPALAAYLAEPAAADHLAWSVRLFDALGARYADPPLHGRAFIAEELVHGRQTTVEGWVRGGRVGILGTVDSVLHPVTGSFERFDYPSRLPAPVVQRMEALAARTALALGLDHTLFNVELVYDERSGRVSILELNPRLCGQFADLYEKVDGVNGYEVAFALATGAEVPETRGKGRFRCAASFPLRAYEPVRVARAPTDDDRRAAEALVPGTLCWSEVESGDLLADFTTREDGHSVRYGVVNLGADDPAELLPRLDAVRARLGWELSPA